MSHSMRPLLIKELRALAPPWVASACAIAAAVLSDPRSHELGLIAYGFGSVMLGAQSVGHEYTHRTLAMLLSQPSSRRRIFLSKAAVLLAMLLTLAVFASLMLLRNGEQGWAVASVLNGLCLAPLLTMASRNPLAGVVFTGGAPIWMFVVSRYVSAGALWGTTGAVSVAAAAASWRLFMRLEAIDGRGGDVRLPAAWRRWAEATFAASSQPVRTKHPVRMLIKKELHLQQMTFAVGIFWFVIWSVESLLTRIVPGFVRTG